ncbi:MAG TPA: aminoglycoside 6-adenylyltransferase [Anaerolineaceae bacterium]|nr:aminoglycoside 6-adenylyltransferase [Anaerolineaceae bacterium]
MEMNAAEKDKQVLDQLVAWGAAREDVRAMVLTSSRTNPTAPVDAFSDYDVIVAVNDIRPYFQDRGWLEDFGRVLVLYRDPIQRLNGVEKFAYITQYEDGLKIDFTLIHPEYLCGLAAAPVLPPDLEPGYIVLLDKDRLTRGMAAPSHRAYIPMPPTESEYLEGIEIFFHEATYLAKYLWRDDLLPARHHLDISLKEDHLLPMMEWLVEIEQGWPVKTGHWGRGLKKWLRRELWAELEGTYAGAGLEENWAAMFRTIDLFQKVAQEVGQALGFEYPLALHERAVRYLCRVRDLDRNAQVASFQE